MLTAAQLQRAGALARVLQLVGDEFVDSLSNEDTEPSAEELELRPFVLSALDSWHQLSVVVGKLAAARAGGL